jgi:PHD/YefM family antitoxin component YafN of YafNO toxin-antitoxin module
VLALAGKPNALLKRIRPHPRAAQQRTPPASDTFANMRSRGIIRPQQIGAKMPVTVPVREMKNTAAFANLVQENGQVVVTKNGYDVIYCESAAQHAINQEAIAKAQLLSRILLAEDEIAAGKGQSYAEFSEGMRAKYGL